MSCRIINLEEYKMNKHVYKDKQEEDSIKDELTKLGITDISREFIEMTVELVNYYNIPIDDEQFVLEITYLAILFHSMVDVRQGGTANYHFLFKTLEEKIKEYESTLK